MTRHYGAVGAAWAWLALNGIYMIVGVPLTHRRLLKGEAFRWFTKDVGIPLAGSLVIAGIARLVFHDFGTHSRFTSVLLLFLVLSATVLGSALLTGATRDFISRFLLVGKESARRAS